MSDLTTTMPILAAPIEDVDFDYDNAPPGEHGHFHDDADFGRHRGGGRSPRALKAAAILTGVVVAGVAVAAAMSGGSGKPTAAPASGNTATAAGTTPEASSAAPDTSSDSVPTDTSSDSQPTSSAPTHSTHSTSTSQKPSTSPRSTTATSAATTARSSTPPANPPAPAFTPLKRGDQGPAVSTLQKNLVAAGYDWAMNGYTNGTFDPQTRQAVRAFQMDHPGTSMADGFGVYGAATNTALQGVLAGNG